MKYSSTSDSWPPGNPLYEIFSILRNYDNKTDEDNIGTENIYKTLFQTGELFDATQEMGDTKLNQVIQSPFDFVNGNVNYNIAINNETDKNGFAIKKMVISIMLFLAGIKNIPMKTNGEFYRVIIIKQTGN